MLVAGASGAALLVSGQASSCQSTGGFLPCRQAACPAKAPLSHVSACAFHPCGLLSCAVTCTVSRFYRQFWPQLEPRGKWPVLCGSQEQHFSPHLLCFLTLFKNNSFLALIDVPDSPAFMCAVCCFQSIHIVCNTTSPVPEHSVTSEETLFPSAVTPSLGSAPDHQEPTPCVCRSGCSARFPPVESP